MKLNKNINIVSLVLLLAIFFEACKTDKIAPLPNPVATTGVVTTIAGSGSFGAANGKRTAASFNYPNGLAIDASGNIYIADKGNNQIRKIVGDSVVSTISGTLLAGSTNATKIGDVASFNGPTGVAVDAGANIYVADFGNQTIRKIATTGAVTVFAGVSGQTGNNDTTITAAVKTPVQPRFNNPAGLAIDAAGNLYVADYTNNSIRKITADGKTVSTIAGKSLGNANGVGTKASFNGPRAIAIDATGNLYVADANNHLIRKIDLTGTVTTIAGTGKAGNSDGTGTAASFSHPSGITIDNAGNLFVADAGNNLIRKITPAGVVSSVAGSGYYNLITPFNGPSAVVANNAGSIYVANTLGNLIQKVATK